MLQCTHIAIHGRSFNITVHSHSYTWQLISCYNELTLLYVADHLMLQSTQIAIYDKYTVYKSFKILHNVMYPRCLCGALTQSSWNVFCNMSIFFYAVVESTWCLKHMGRITCSWWVLTLNICLRSFPAKYMLLVQSPPDCSSMKINSPANGKYKKMWGAQ